MHFDHFPVESLCVLLQIVIINKLFGVFGALHLKSVLFGHVFAGSATEQRLLQPTLNITREVLHRLAHPGDHVHNLNLLLLKRLVLVLLFASDLYAFLLLLQRRCWHWLVAGGSGWLLACVFGRLGRDAFHFMLHLVKVLDVVLEPTALDFLHFLQFCQFGATHHVLDFLQVLEHFLELALVLI